MMTKTTEKTETTETHGTSHTHRNAGSAFAFAH